MARKKMDRKYVWNVCVRIPTSTSKTVHCASFLKPIYDVIWERAFEDSDKEVEQLEPRKYWDSEEEEEGDMVYGRTEIFDCATTKKQVKMRFARLKVDDRPVFSLAYPGKTFENEFADCMKHYSTDLIVPRALTRKEVEVNADQASKRADAEGAKAVERANEEARSIADTAGIDLEQEDAEDELGKIMNESVDVFNDEDISVIPVLARKSEIIETMKELGFDSVSGLASATVKQLTSINGIGESTAASIITQSQDLLPDKQYN